MKLTLARVIKGCGLGRKIGVPTINFDPTLAKGLKTGIYLCKVSFPPAIYWGLLHFGPRPTFGDSKYSLEVYLLDFEQSIKIPRKLDVEILNFIRAVKVFDSAQSMVMAIEEDVREANRIIARSKSD